MYRQVINGATYFGLYIRKSDRTVKQIPYSVAAHVLTVWINSSDQLASTNEFASRLEFAESAFIWSGGRFNEVVESTYTSAVGINDSGDIAGQAVQATEGYLLTSSGQLTKFQVAPYMLVYCVNNSDIVTGCAAPEGTECTEGFLWMP